MNFGFFKIRLKNNGCLKIFILRIVGMDAINDQGMIIDCMIIDCMIIEVFLALDSFLTLRVR